MDFCDRFVGQRGLHAFSSQFSTVWVDFCDRFVGQRGLHAFLSQFSTVWVDFCDRFAGWVRAAAAGLGLDR